MRRIQWGAAHIILHCEMTGKAIHTFLRPYVIVFHDIAHSGAKVIYRVMSMSGPTYIVT